MKRWRASIALNSTEDARNAGCALDPFLLIELHGGVVADEDIRLRRRKIGKNFVKGHVSQRGPLARDRLKGPFEGGVGGQPQELTEHEGVLVLDREAAEVVTGA